MSGQYLKVSPIELGDWYSLHVDAMTREGLHSKSSIAVQLAIRDRRIAELESERKVLLDEYARSREFIREVTDRLAKWEQGGGQ